MVARIAGFTTWLKRQRGRQDPVGDLARDAMEDPDWPKAGVTHHRYWGYLQHRASAAALRALDRAWDEYLDYRRQQVRLNWADNLRSA